MFLADFGFKNLREFCGKNQYLHMDKMKLFIEWPNKRFHVSEQYLKRIIIIKIHRNCMILYGKLYMY